jgi:hypothetical protein
MLIGRHIWMDSSMLVVARFSVLMIVLFGLDDDDSMMISTVVGMDGFDDN